MPTNWNLYLLHQMFFITSKIKPTSEYEGERGNILFEGHDIEKKENTRLVIC